MQRYINCLAHHSSEGQLLIGDTHTALIDPGMMFCARETIQNVKNALNGRPLDYILIGHTHYDHVGALPFFRTEWPDVQIAATASGAAVLQKDTPRTAYWELSNYAAAMYNRHVEHYDVHLFWAGLHVKDGDTINLGNLTVQIIETPGHTRDALSFFVPELEMIFLNETLGVLLPDNTIHPCYLTSYHDTIASIEKCRVFNAAKLALPHRGIVGAELSHNFFEKALDANVACRDFIADLHTRGVNDDTILDEFFARYGKDCLLQFQPKEAFVANARATIACTIREL